MTLRIFTIGLLSVAVMVTASSTVVPRTHSHVPRVAGTGKLHVYGTRSSAQAADAASAKYDSALADITRHLTSVRPAHAIADLHALHPAARFRQSAAGEPLVLVDAITRGDPQQLKSALVGLGLEKVAVFSNDVSGWLPVARLSAATQYAEVHAIRASMPRTRTGAVTSQGDYVQRSDIVRANNALDGGGVTVGVLSDSYDCYPVYASNTVPASGNAGYAYNGFNTTASGDQATGDLPAATSITVVEEASCLDYDPGTLLPFGDEGRAMMQIVHDVAPGAKLSFYTAENGEADFASGIGTLARQGAKVIADDVGYFDEPFWQDGLVAQAIDTVEAGGVAYFSAAGNNGTQAYDNLAPSFATLSTTAPTAGEHLLNFAQPGASVVTSLPVSIPALQPGEFVGIVLEWDQPYVSGAADSGGSTNRLNLCITGITGNDVVGDDNLDPLTSNCTGANTVGTDPVQIIIVGNPTGAVADPNGNSSAETINIVVGLVSGAAPGRIKIAVEDDGAGSVIDASLATNGGTVQGHPGAAGAAAVGAAFYYDTPDCGESPAQLEPFSSAGGDPILFDVNGMRLTTPVVRQKPDFTGPDGGNDTFLGFTLADAGFTGGQVTTTVPACENVTTFPYFFGTSAATPHVASIAALYLQANPAVTPSEIYAALRATALPIVTSGSSSAGTTGYTVYGGFGFVQADAAAEQIPAVVPAAPTLTLASASIAVNAATTLSWSSANDQGCTASGSWSGALASSGSQTVTPTTAGSNTYTLLCTNSAGASASTSVVLTVTAAAATTSGGSHGGGSLDASLLLALLSLVGLRYYSPNRRAR